MSDHSDVPSVVRAWFKEVGEMLHGEADKFTCTSNNEIWATHTMSMQAFCDIMAFGEDMFPTNGLVIWCDNGDTLFLRIKKTPTDEWVSIDIPLRTMSLPREIYFSAHDEEGCLINECVGHMWKDVRLHDTYHLEFRPKVIPDSFWSENRTWVTNMCALSSPNLVSLSWVDDLM